MTASARARRAYGSGGLRQNPKTGKWHGKVEFPRVNGQRRPREVVRDSKSAANTAINALRAERDGGDAAPTLRQAGGVTVGEWLDTWIGAGAGGVKPKTLVRYAGLVRYQLKPALGHHRLAALRPDLVREGYTKIAEQDRLSTTRQPIKGSRLSTSTLWQAHHVLMKAVKDALADDHIKKDYLAGRVKAPPRQSTKAGKGRALTLAQARAVLAAAKRAQRPVRWNLALTTGSRQAEVLGLLRDDIDWDQNRITVAHQLHYETWKHGCPANARCAAYLKPCPPDTPPCSGDPARGCNHAWHKARKRSCPKPKKPHSACRPGGPCSYQTRFCPQAVGGPKIVPSPKSDNDRIVLMTTAVRDELKAHLLAQDAAREAAGGRWETRPEFADLVFAGPLGQPVNPRDDHADWKALLKDADVPESRLHDARTTTATILTALGFDTAIIQLLLGHSSVTTTNGYQDLTAEILQPAIDRLGAALANDTEPQAKSRSKKAKVNGNGDADLIAALRAEIRAEVEAEVRAELQAETDLPDPGARRKARPARPRGMVRRDAETPS